MLADVQKVGQGVFNYTRDTLSKAQPQARLLGLNGAANMVVGRPGILENMLNIAGIASMFIPVLMPFVAALNLARSGLDFAKALGCLFTGDISGCLSNIFTGVINGFCAMPQIKGLTNVLKAGALKPGNIGAEEIKKYTTETLRAKLQQSQKFVSGISSGLKKDLEGVEKEILVSAEKVGVIAREGKEAASKLGVDRFETQIVKATESKLTEQITTAAERKLAEKATQEAIEVEVKKAVEVAEEKAKEAVRIQTKEAAEKRITEQAKKSAEKELEAFQKIQERRSKIQGARKDLIPHVRSAHRNLRRVESAIKNANGKELSEILNLGEKPLEVIELDYQKFIKDASTEAYGKHATHFNKFVDEVACAVTQPGGVKKVVDDTVGKVKATAKDFRGKSTTSPTIHVPTTEEAIRYSQGNVSDETVRRTLAQAA